MATALPEYVRASVPNIGNREPWYKNTAPAYAGTFLWVAFYQSANIPARPAPVSP